MRSGRRALCNGCLLCYGESSLWDQEFRREHANSSGVLLLPPLQFLQSQRENFRTANAIGSPTSRGCPIGPVMYVARLNFGQPMSDNGITTKYMNRKTHSPKSSPQMIGCSMSTLIFRLAT